MRTQHAVRNIRLCTKDCLCLYVCPVGASDTENGQIDWEKCTGCGACAVSCPSGAISMMPEVLPAQQKKTEAVIHSLTALADSKMKEEAAALKTAADTSDQNEKKLAAALARSNRIMAEDLIREAGYMLPQSANAHELLVSMLDDPAGDFPVKTAEELIEMLKVNEQ